MAKDRGMRGAGAQEPLGADRVDGVPGAQGRPGHRDLRRHRPEPLGRRASIATAVERMASIKGGWGRVVWMPTFDSENQVRYSKENRPFVPVSKNGQLLPEVKEVIGVVAKRRLTLETGHSSAAECLAIIREARRQGVEHIVVTHAMLPPVGMSIAQMQEAAKEGAYLEFVYNALIGPNKAFEIGDVREGDPRRGAAALHPVERSRAGRESAASGRAGGILQGAARRRNSGRGDRPDGEDESRQGCWGCNS